MEYTICSSYGAMTEVLSFYGEIEVLRYQQLSKWWYSVGVSRVQTRLILTQFYEHESYLTYLHNRQLLLFDIKSGTLSHIGSETKHKARLDLLPHGSCSV